MTKLVLICFELFSKKYWPVIYVLFRMACTYTRHEYHFNWLPYLSLFSWCKYFQPTMKTIVYQHPHISILDDTDSLLFFEMFWMNSYSCTSRYVLWVKLETYAETWVLNMFQEYQWMRTQKLLISAYASPINLSWDINSLPLPLVLSPRFHINIFLV